MPGLKGSPLEPLMKNTPSIIDRFIFNLKQEFSGKAKAIIIQGPCKATTNEITWMKWMDEFPEAEFFTKEIGSRVYFMTAAKYRLDKKNGKIRN